MIKSLTVTNPSGESLKLVLGDSDTSGFLITDIDGIGPSKATINSTEMATGDGSIFNSSRLESRNIRLSITFDNRYDVEKLRLKTYKYFPIKKNIRLVFETESRICSLHGYVESNEPYIFNPMEGTQISIICPDPYFYDAGENSNNETFFGSTAEGFEFTYDPELDYGTISNESLDEPLLEFGKISTTDLNSVHYNGDSEVGILIIIHAYSEVGTISISNLGTGELMKIDSNRIKKLTGKKISDNDEIYISTVRNDKYIRLLRDGKFVNILNCLDKKTDWFKLSKGDNVLTYSLEDGVGTIQFKIINRTLYEGV